jgi:hypothetical protein
MHHRIGYELPSAIRKGKDMGVGFGFGGRSKNVRREGGKYTFLTLTNFVDSVSPDKYEIVSVFDKVVAQSKMETST